MAITSGILLFDDAEELDFAGPWEVLTSSAMLAGAGRVVTVAEAARPVACAKGMRVVPDHTFADAPALDVLLVPGGLGTRREEYAGGFEQGPSPWPAARNPSTRVSGISATLCMTGGMYLCAERMERFGGISPRTTAAVVTAVVSNPVAKNTTSPDVARARSSA